MRPVGREPAWLRRNTRLMNKFWNTAKLAIRNLTLHKLRVLLTALGLIFGVASVIAMMAIT